MMYEEYIDLAMRTSRKDLSKTDSLLNACLGLAGEYAELRDTLDVDDRKNELGDLHWYFALAYVNSEIDNLEDVSTEMDDINLLKTIGNLCDYVKKIVYQGHELDKVEMTNLISKLFNRLRQECYIQGFSQTEIMQLNIDKLMRRYPEGFTVKDSIHRVI